MEGEQIFFRIKGCLPAVFNLFHEREVIHMYLLHRIQKENGSFSKGIEIHEDLNDAIRAYWGRVKTGYNNPDFPGMTFISVKITDEVGNVISGYESTWLKEREANAFFLHHVQNNNGNITKDIDILPTQDAAIVSMATHMEYGYENPKFPKVSLVYCEITDILSGFVLDKATWQKPEPEPEPEPEEPEE